MNWKTIAADLKTKGWPLTLIDHVGWILRDSYLHTKYENADNLRLARIEDSAEVAIYKDQFARGCCGFFDTLVMVQGDDRRVHGALIGFNYGH